MKRRSRPRPPRFVAVRFLEARFDHVRAIVGANKVRVYFGPEPRLSAVVGELVGQRR